MTRESQNLLRNVLNHPRSLWILAGILLGLSCLLINSSAIAQDADSDETPFQLVDSPITAKVTLGLSPDYPYRRDNSWIPIIAEITNRDDAIQGELVVRLKDGKITYKTAVNLARNSTSRVDLYARVPDYLDEFEFYLRQGNSEIPIEIVTINASYPQTNRFVAVLSKEPGSHDHFAHRAEDDADLYRRVIYTSARYLPNHSIGYQNIDVLLWDGGETTSISAKQSMALEKWIQMGGTLILAAGEYWQELNNSPFRLYVPMTLTGSRVLNEGTRLESETETIKPKLNSSRVISTGTLLDDPKATVRLHSGDDPFLVERTWGGGRIIFIASSIDDVLLDDPIHQVILQDYVTHGPLALDPSVVNEQDFLVSGFLRWMVQKELPSTWFIAIYLGCYILIVVPINYIVFRLIGRLEWAWFTVPIWAILFAYGAYYIGALRQQGNVAVNQISIIEIRPGANAGYSTTYSSIYSPIRQWYTLKFQQPMAFPDVPQLDTMQNNRVSWDASLVIDFGASATVEDYLIYHWSQRLLKANHEAPLGKGVEVQLNWEGDILSGSITNNTGYVLHDPILYLSDRLLKFPTMSNGQQEMVDADRNTMPPFHIDQALQETNNRYYNFQQYNRDPGQFIEKMLKKSYAAQLIHRQTSQGMTVFVARIDQPQLPFSINDVKTEAKGQSLLCVPISLKKQMHGRMILNNEFWQFGSGVNIMGNRFQGGFGGGGYREADQISIQPNNEYAWDIQSTVPIEGGHILSLSIKMEYNQMMSLQGGQRGSTYQLNASGVPSNSDYELHLQNTYTLQYEPLSTITNAQGDVTNPRRYIDPLSGSIAARLKAPNQGVHFMKQNLKIELDINYGSEAGGKFLGRMLDAVMDEETIKELYIEGE